jgi:hypothetical protein
MKVQVQRLYKNSSQWEGFPWRVDNYLDSQENPSPIGIDTFITKLVNEADYVSVHLGLRPHNPEKVESA